MGSDASGAPRVPHGAQSHPHLPPAPRCGGRRSPSLGQPCRSRAAPRQRGQRPGMDGPGQAQALRDAIAPEYGVVVLLGYWCGLRLGEIAALRRRDVDLLRSRIYVERTSQQTADGVTFGPPKTRAGRRTVPVSRTVMREIGKHLASFTGPGGDVLVVTTSSGTPLLRQNVTRRAWRAGLRSASLPEGLTPHSMRHGFASLLIGGGFFIKEVSQWCGHASTAVTLSVYAHITAESEDDAPDRLDALLTSAGRARRARQLR